MEQQKIKILYQPLKAKWYRMIAGGILHRHKWVDIKGFGNRERAEKLLKALKKE